MSSRAPLTQRPFSPPLESGRPALCVERIHLDVTPEQIQAVLRDIIRRDPDLWRRVQQDGALWQAFGFDTESGDTEPGTVRRTAGLPHTPSL